MMEITDFSEQARKMIRSTEFSQLSDLIKPFSSNLWVILGISRKENLVSRFLAWLLSANIGHDICDAFLKEFLIQVLTNEGRQKFSDQPTPADILLGDFSQLEVKVEESRQSRRFDILLLDKQAIMGEGFVCLIENKIGSLEGRDQTHSYYNISLDEYPREQYPFRLYIYLTPEGVGCDDTHFILVSYQLILDVIKRIQDTKTISQRDRFLLEQFKESIMSEISQDQKMVDLAQAIYNQYRDVLRFIYQNSEDEVEQSSASGWDGLTWFFNIGENIQGTGYSWDDSFTHSFICAGGAKRYRSIMERFVPEHIIYAYVSGCGYVGKGRVIKSAEPFRNATLANGQSLLQLKPSLKGNYNASDNDDICDWIVLIDWEIRLPKFNAVKEPPLTPQTACRIYEDRKPAIESIQKLMRTDQMS